MIRTYTRESGVRDLERMISKLCRKIVLKSEIMVDEKSSAGADESDAESAPAAAEAADAADAAEAAEDAGGSENGSEGGSEGGSEENADAPSL